MQDMDTHVKSTFKHEDSIFARELYTSFSSCLRSKGKKTQNVWTHAVLGNLGSVEGGTEIKEIKFYETIIMLEARASSAFA